MYWTKQWLCLVILSVTFKCAVGFWFPSHLETGISAVKKASRWNIPWLNIGIQCNGCPPKSCEDDEAVIHGYCCGCAYSGDRLPVMCPQFLQCPLNLQGLCHDYEYMMRCCC
ncbi:uncharacterized protein LOC126375094 [Pectinophora gossypiella]|uniref:uncharacterized protein LOC126375094 n=1 Tax=Pectinophora gossypiella TaxID=13191 RepID=UPI00214E268E|nr:uncharacterized protein LOC126375094 [Pectinophora gossypiella]